MILGSNNSKPTFVCLETGGTFASVSGPDGKTPELSIQDIIAKHITESLGMADIIFPSPQTKFHFGELVDSSNIQPEDWVTLANAIALHIENPSVEGILITSGTDTMAFMSSALSLIVKNPPKPIIITGSQRTFEEADSDAKSNFIQSLKFLAKASAGIYICFDQELFDGKAVSKISSQDLAAFASINPVPFRVKPNGSNRQEPFRIDARFENRVKIETLIPGYEPAWLRSILENEEIKGVLIQGFGKGGIPNRGRRELISLIEEFSDQKPIVICSHCLFGGVDLTQYEVGIRALKAGAISAGNYSLEYASFRLKALLARCSSVEEVRMMWVDEDYKIH